MAIKVLFLDIDGVLVTTRSSVALGGTPRTLSPDDLARFDPCAVALVRKLCDETGVQVVVTSDWRDHHDWADIGRALELPVVGATPATADIRASCRGEEIQAWLDAHPDVREWAILDDRGDMLEHQLPRLVQTEFEDGVLWRHYRTLMHML